MSESIVKYLIGLGAIIFAVWNCSDGVVVAIIGGLLIGAEIIIAIRAVNTLPEGEVVDSWSALIENGQGSAEGVLEDSAKFIPKLKISTRKGDEWHSLLKQEVRDGNRP